MYLYRFGIAFMSVEVWSSEQCDLSVYQKLELNNKNILGMNLLVLNEIELYA